MSRRRVWLAAGAAYVALALLPIMYYGLNDDSVIAAFTILFMVPTLTFFVYAAITTIWRALSPPATIVLDAFMLAIFATVWIMKFIRRAMRGL